MGARRGVDRRLDESTATLTFIYEQNNNGMQSILFKYDNVTDKLYVASSINHNSGGGSSRIGGVLQRYHPRYPLVYYQEQKAKRQNSVYRRSQNGLYG